MPKRFFCPCSLTKCRFKKKILDPFLRFCHLIYLELQKVKYYFRKKTLQNPVNFFFHEIRMYVIKNLEKKSVKIKQKIYFKKIILMWPKKKNMLIEMFIFK